MSIQKITSQNYEQLVVNATCPVLLDFWATWCGPCKMIAPVIDEIAEERADILVGKIDVDEERELAIRFGITSIPTLVVMENGQKKAQMLDHIHKEHEIELEESLTGGR